YPTSAQFFSASSSVLKETTLLSQNSIELINLLKSIAKKLETPQARHQKLNTTILAKKFCKSLFADFGTETFYCLCLDNTNHLTAFSVLGYGTNSNANLRMKEIVELAFKFRSNKIIICHNHPSGLALPSRDDELFTKRLTLNLMLNDIIILDHIIITEHQETSMLEMGTLEEIKLDVFNNCAIPNKKQKQYLYLDGGYKKDDT
ncbi:MAG: JAB domain-containing protein, partial [Clostridia bacterium]|nr:JAB domain-containing protein [Clostridia bacterium]